MIASDSWSFSSDSLPDCSHERGGCWLGQAAAGRLHEDDETSRGVGEQICGRDEGMAGKDKVL